MKCLIARLPVVDRADDARADVEARVAAAGAAFAVVKPRQQRQSRHNGHGREDHQRRKEGYLAVVERKMNGGRHDIVREKHYDGRRYRRYGEKHAHGDADAQVAGLEPVEPRAFAHGHKQVDFDQAYQRYPYPRHQRAAGYRQDYGAGGYDPVAPQGMENRPHGV